MKDIPYLLTYPRSGSHYFDELVYKEAKIHIEKSHFVNLLFDKNNNKKRTILTIARDPKDTIISLITVETQYLVKKMSSPEFVNQKLNEIITSYILLYSFLCDHADYVIDFNDLTEYPNTVIKKTLNLLEINEENHNLFYKGEQPYSKKYVPSSKKLLNYDKDLLNKYKLIFNFNIDLCYFYYNRLLEKKIKI